MGLAVKAAVTVAAGMLAAALAGPVAGGPAAGLTSAAGTGAPTASAAVTVQPALLHTLGSSGQPLTTADCEAAYQVACYEPPQIQQAYDLGPLYTRGVTGQGTTIVIVDSFGSPTIEADLATFDQTFRLPAPPSLRIIQPDGAIPAYDPGSSMMLSWAGETTLDVEYAHTVAPGASILLVETPVAETEGVTGFPQIVQAENYVIDHHLGDVISQSFSATEQTFSSAAAVQALRSSYTNAAADGVTVLAAAGDSGAANEQLNGQTYYTDPTTTWPASDPLVTAVGGTQLHLDASGNHTGPDTVWNDTYSMAANQFVFGDNGPNPLAGGGGRSVLFARPSYQDSVQAVVGGRRGVPDVSMSAACNGAVDVYQSFPGLPAGWYPTCGTSEATPLFAGIVALADQVAGHPLGLINPELYLMSAMDLPGLVDVTSGSTNVTFSQNGQTDTVQGTSASSGYDLASGVGTVSAATFVPELALLAGQ
jgi:subtilase family serine protease